MKRRELADFQRPGGKPGGDPRRGQHAGRLDGALKRVAADDVEAEQLLQGLGEGAIEDRDVPSRRTVVAVAVGIRRATGPSLPCAASFRRTTASSAISAASCSCVIASTEASGS